MSIDESDLRLMVGQTCGKSESFLTATLSKAMADYERANQVKPQLILPPLAAVRRVPGKFRNVPCPCGCGRKVKSCPQRRSSLL